MKHVLALLLLGCLYASSAWSQCAPGIPEAGNPECIPPDQKESPYYQGNTAPKQPPVIYSNRWGAVVIDANTGQAGMSANKHSKSEAVDAAMADCQIHGSPNCRVRNTYFNECVAIAWGNNSNSVSSAETIELAEANSMKSCTSKGVKCEIVYKECSLAERVK
jgi:hypothetical protein